MAKRELAEPQKTKLWRNLEIANLIAIAIAIVIIFHKIYQADTSYETHRWSSYLSLASVICFANIITISQLQKRSQKN